MQDPANPYNLSDCLDFAWTKFKQHLSDYVVAHFVLLVPYSVAGAAFSMLGPKGYVLSCLLPAMLWTGSMSVARAAKPTLEDAFRPFRERQGDYLMVCLAMSAGLIVCFIGALVTWFVCTFAALLALEGRDFQRAVIESKDIVLKYPGDVALLGVVVCGINFAGAAACWIGLVFSMPIASLTVVRAFQQLSERFARDAAEGPRPIPNPPAY